jgi:RNase H-fold protein (predicted Holliday junction resolvase)
MGRGSLDVSVLCNLFNVVDYLRIVYVPLVASALGRVSRPEGVIKNNGNLTAMALQVLELSKQRGAVEVLVGVPVDSNGKLRYKIKNFNGNLCLNFSRVLAAVASVVSPRIQVRLVDERFSTRVTYLLFSLNVDATFL